MLDFSRQKAPERLVRPQISAKFVMDIDTGWRLKLSSSTDITVNALQYLDKFDSTPPTPRNLVPSTGREFEIPIDLSAVSAICPFKEVPNSWGGGYFRMKFRVDLLFGKQVMSHLIPVIMHTTRSQDSLELDQIEVFRA